MHVEERQKSPVVSIIGLVVGVIAVLLSAVPIINNFAFVLAILALILGVVGVVQARSGRYKGRSLAIIAIVLALVAGGIVLASQKFYSDAIDEATTEANDTMDRASGEKTDEILGKEVDVVLGDFTATEGEFTTETQLPVKVTNKNDETKSYSVHIEAVDENGARIAEDTVYVNDLGANQSQDFKAFEFVQSDQVEALKTAEFKIVSVSQF